YREGKAHVPPSRDVVGEVDVEALRGVGGGVRAVVEDLRLEGEAGAGAAEPEGESVRPAPVLRTGGAGGGEVHAQAAEVADREVRDEQAVGADLPRAGQCVRVGHRLPGG